MRFRSVFAVATLILCGAFLAGTGRCSERTVVTASGVTPGVGALDHGPDVVAGADAGQSGGVLFDWVDASAVGGTQYRLYFDRQDNRNFHYLDREGARLRLGLCEAGVDQLLAAATLADPNAKTVRVARHGLKIGVFADRQLVLSACDDRCTSGTAGLRTLPGSERPVFSAVRREDIRFYDDFMRDDKEDRTWRQIRGDAKQGGFAIKSLRNPLMSANAFNYMGAGPGVLSVTGEPWWDNYRFEASLRGPANGRIGLVFAFQDDKNYGLFRWEPRRANPDGTPISPGLRELVRVCDGKEEVLASVPSGCLPRQWYRAEALVTHGRVRITVDGHALFEVSNPFLAAGGVGLWCDVPAPEAPATDPKASDIRFNSLWDLMNQHAVFDDVRVTSVAGVEDDFRLAGPLRQGWLAGLGEWQVSSPSPAAAGVLAANSLPGPSKCLIGNAQWGQYRLACDVNPGGGKAGLVFLYRDEARHFCARTDGKVLELVRIQDGKEEVLAKESLKNPRVAGDGFLRLGVLAKEGYVRVNASDGTVVETLEPAGTLRGRAGLYAAPPASGGQAPRFRRFRLLFLEEPEPLVTTNAIFEDEDTMSDWTSTSKEWLPQQTPITVDGQSIIPLWHGCQFPGDVELVVEPRQVLEPRHEIALSVAKDGRGSLNGYVFLYQAGRPGKDGKPGTLLKILRKGEPVAERVLPEGAVRQLSNVSCQRAGPYVIGKINGKAELVYRDAEPLTGGKVAYYAKGLAMRAEASRILSDTCLDELFARAPVDWRMAGYAISEVTNRWACDPRWTFFSLKNDRSRGKPAVMWNKYQWPGDLTVEFFVGNKMEEDRGPRYTYARDIAVTLCGDGGDLTQGYTCVWGAEGNRATVIYRNGKEVKRVERTIPTAAQRVHRAWMLMRVEKRAGRVALHVDRLPDEPPIDLVFEDPEPLTGNRVALWTYDHAIMLSRVRVTGEGAMRKEDPDQVFPPLRTIYDQP